MITIICDVCGKKIEDSEEIRHFDTGIHVCLDCLKLLNYDEWKQAKKMLFKRFIAKLTKPAKPAKETCTCKCARKPAAKAEKPVAVKTTCNGKCQHEHKLLTNVELAAEIGKKANIVQCYAYRNGLGITDKKRRVRLYNQEDADKIRKHFEK